jgi:hypothetical protein
MNIASLCQNPLIEQSGEDASQRRGNRSQPMMRNCFEALEELGNEPIAERWIGGEAPACPRLTELQSLKKTTRRTAVGRLQSSAFSESSHSTATQMEGQ